MLFRMLDFMCSPFVLLLLAYNSGNYSSRIPMGKPIEYAVSEVNNTSLCPLLNERTVSLLFYDHPNPQIRGCYEEEGTDGPCGQHMKLYRINDSRNGECDCDLSSARLLLYVNETKHCYPIFSQAYCEKGEQLVITRANLLIPVCRRTVCYDELRNPDNEGKDLVPFENNSSCVEVGSRSKCLQGVIGFTLSEKNINVSSVEREKQRRIAATCINPRFRSIGAPPVRCSPGTYRAISGHCQPPIFSYDDWE